jgi:hypothetical protein
LVYPKTVLHYDLEDLLLYICEDPATWITKDSQSDISFIESLLATEPSTGITEKIVKDMKDLSFIINLKSQCYHDYFNKHDTLRLQEKQEIRLPPGFRF